MTTKTGTPKKQSTEVLVVKMAQGLQELSQQFAQLNADFQTLRDGDQYKTKYLKIVESDLQKVQNQYFGLVSVLFKVVKYGVRQDDGTMAIPRNQYDINEPPAGVNQRFDKENGMVIISVEETETEEKK